jgi:RNA polymerase sigma factor (sigma-70 family)
MSNHSIVIGWRQRWNRSLLQFLGRRVRRAFDIEDLAHETYLRLLRAKDLREVHNPQAYLLSVASHVVSEWREREPPAHQWVVMDENLLIDDHRPELAVDAHLSQAQLDQVLASLSPQTRAVVLLKCRDERSCKEIATELALTDRQVRRHLTRGYEILRRSLER